MTAHNTWTILYVLQILSLFLIVLLVVAYLTLSERKIIASVQSRQGPDYVGFFGLLQPIADGIKLITKEFIIPSQSNVLYFIAAPIIVFVCAFLQWCQIPLSAKSGCVLAVIDLSLLYLSAFGSLGNVGVFLAGWSSNSKYALLGGLRGIAQMISYELALTTVFLCIVTYAGTLNIYYMLYLQSFVVYLVLPLLPVCILFYIITVAETNRSPFDLPEGESEIVAGFNVEYSGILFALFFLGEYAKIIAVSALNILFFFGGWHVFSIAMPYAKYIVHRYAVYAFSLSAKVLFISSLFILIRAVLPRYRVDQLMRLGWKIFLPMLLAIFIFINSFHFLLSAY